MFCNPSIVTGMLYVSVYRMTVWLSTAPTEPLTHWYQVRCLLQSPLFAKAGDTMSGTALLIANKRWAHAILCVNPQIVNVRWLTVSFVSASSYRQSYDISIVAQVDQTGSKSSNLLDLKNPFFRWEDALLRKPIRGCLKCVLLTLCCVLQVHGHNTHPTSRVTLFLPLREHVEHWGNL